MRLFRFILFFHAFFISAFMAYSQTGNRHIELNGNFSICPPIGWSIIELPGIKYKIFHGQAINGFSPNIVIVDEIYEGSLDEYLRLNNQNTEKVYPDAELVSTTSIKTNNGLNGRKQIYLNASSGRLLRQYFYYFSNNSTKYVITCTVPNNSGQNYDRIFDESIKTFEFIRK
jgi:hypothetical protein